MNALKSRVTYRPSVLSRKIFRLERCGRYEDALGLLTADWPAPDMLPDTRAMPAAEAARLQLRYGALVGFIGHSQNISGSQARSKDLVTEAREMFLSIADVAGVAECENFISLAYWRTGEYPEAETWIGAALEHDVPPGSDVRLYSHMVRSLILMDSCRHEENIAYCKSLEETFRLDADAYLNGGLCANLGISLKDVGRTAEALAYLDLANAFQERSRHKHFLGAANNNLALLYKDLGRFHMAHFCVDKAIAIYKKIGDKAREGSSFETKAQIYVAERRLGLAMTTIGRSIAILRKSENQRYLAESIMSRSKIYVAEDNFADAIISLLEAVEITRNCTGEKAVRQLIGEFKTALDEIRDRSSQKETAAKTGEVEMILPPAIAHYQDYKGVWIHNSHLDAAGVSQGSLVLVVDEPLKRGGAAAVLHTASGEVSCGFYDAEFGIIALEGAGEPQLFDQESVKVLGKIVGVCSPADDGKMTVQPLSI